MAAWIAGGTLVASLALLASGRVRLDLVGILVLGTLGVTRVVGVQQLFAGFGSEAVILVAGMLALGQVLVATGVTDRLGHVLARLMGEGGGRGGAVRATAVLMGLAGPPSALVSDVGLVAVLLPLVLGLGRRIGLEVRRLLLPMAVAAMLGGLLTMVGSAGNIVGNAALIQGGAPGLGLFAITPLGAVLLAAGVLFTVAFGRRLLPRGDARRDPLAELRTRRFMAELRIEDGASLDGRRLGEVEAFAHHDVAVLHISRNGWTVPVRPAAVLAAGESLVVAGEPEAITRLVDDERLGLALVGEELQGAEPPGDEGVVLAEALVGPRSPVVGITIGRLDLARRTGAAVLAISRQGVTVPRRLAFTVLQPGDVLLLQGTPERIAEACRGRGLIVLEEPRARVRRGGFRAALAVGIFVAALGVAALGWLPIQLAVTLGVALAVLTGLLGADEAYAAVDWHILVFIAGMTPLAGALVTTGVAGHVAQALVGAAHVLGGSPRVELALLFALAAALTQALSNVATVLVLAPMALSVARLLHQPPQLFVAVVIAAVSAAPITPMSSKVNLLVIGPGGYRYGDFVRFGLPLTLLLGAVTVLLAPVLVRG